MTPLSGRYAMPVLILLALAIVPIALHAQDRQSLDPCAFPEALRAPEAWGHDPFRAPPAPRPSSKWWSEGFVREPAADGGLLHFAILRSQRPSRLYLRPHAFVDEEMEPDITRTIEIEGLDGRPFPVRLSTQRRPPWTRMMLGVYIWENEAVASPFGTLVRNALPDLVEGTPPLDMLVVGAIAHDDDRREVRAHMEQWLREAWDRYQRVCGAPR